ncbi:uncharacterized protein METZ01_LOCUS517296, partial [marine metagenome]
VLEQVYCYTYQHIVSVCAVIIQRRGYDMLKTHTCGELKQDCVGQE